LRGFLVYKITITTKGREAVFEPATCEIYGVLHDDGTEEKQFGIFQDGVLLDWTKIESDAWWKSALWHADNWGTETIRLPSGVTWKIEWLPAA
jgi:hypothetical protein